jgi:hypothetical protein
MNILQKLNLLGRIETLEQLAESEKNYVDYCKLQAEIWRLQCKLNKLETRKESA